MRKDDSMTFSGGIASNVLKRHSYRRISDL